VVEFTPSRWSKSVSLMNAAHWLFAGTGFLSFSFLLPSKCHATFDTEDQFGGAVAEIAREAGVRAREIEQKFPTTEAIAGFLVGRARCSDRMRASWWGYEAGIASSLCNRFDDAEYFLRGITDERVIPYAVPLLALVKNPESFIGRVNELVVQQRASLKLAALECDPF